MITPTITLKLTPAQYAEIINCVRTLADGLNGNNLRMLADDIRQQYERQKKS